VNSMIASMILILVTTMIHLLTSLSNTVNSMIASMILMIVTTMITVDMLTTLITTMTMIHTTTPTTITIMIHTITLTTTTTMTLIMVMIMIAIATTTPMSMAKNIPIYLNTVIMTMALTTLAMTLTMTMAPTTLAMTLTMTMAPTTLAMTLTMTMDMVMMTTITCTVTAMKIATAMEKEENTDMRWKRLSTPKLEELSSIISGTLWITVMSLPI